ncbi:MAG: EAL domain-containing protein [Acidobacteriota bacterium]|nr:EAL domain-containing protein [Acidobacteriota bacterium]
MKQPDSVLDGRTLGRLDRWRNARALFVRAEGAEAEQAVALAFGRRWSRAQVYGRARRLLVDSSPERFLESLEERLGLLADRVRVAPEDPGQTKWDALGNLTTLSRARSELRALWLADLLRSGDFYTKFQPIADLETGKAIGYEGLLRARADSASRPSAEMFPAARALRLERPFETLSWLCVVEAAGRLAAGNRLFLNVNPQLLAEKPDELETLWRALDDAGVAASRVVLDLVEVESVENLEGLARAVADAREHDVVVALDDMTSPYRAIKLCESFRPEWAKVDWEITRGVARDPRRRSILRFFGRLAKHFSFGLIAEGVENREDLDVCADAGVVAAQGYLVGRPAPDPPAPSPEFLEWVGARRPATRMPEPAVESENGAESEERAS